MEVMKYSTIGSCLYIRPSMHEPLVFIEKLPSTIVALIPTKKKLIVKLEDGQIRYFDKKLRPFTYNK
jgi:hypothetical protein